MVMEENMLRVMVPDEEITEVKDGEQKTRSRKKFPGYVLVEMVMSDEAWFVVRNTPGVTGFVGSHGAGSKPSPLLEEEAAVLLGEAQMKPKEVQLNVEVGDRVEIIDGAFSGLSGEIEEIEADQQRLKVVIEMFGRETVAELDFYQVKKENI